MYVICNNSKVAYREAGQGDCLVLLHGFCEDSTMWADFVSLLSKKYFILTIDLSGFGESDLLKTNSIEAMSEAVYAVVKKSGVDSCVLTGHSMGGYVALSFAEKYPEMLSGLGLFHSHPFRDSDEKINNRLKTIRFIERHGIAPFAGQFVRNLFAKSFVKKNKPFIEDLIHNTSVHHSDAVIAASYAMINRGNKEHVLTNLSCPALFIIGKLDNSISMEYSLGQLALPEISSVHIFDDVAHMAMFEKKVETLEIIAGFMDFCKHSVNSKIIKMD
jgi:pimeloyl-ACP methyl ester carboxylesterase